MHDGEADALDLLFKLGELLRRHLEVDGFAGFDHAGPSAESQVLDDLHNFIGSSKIR